MELSGLRGSPRLPTKREFRHAGQLLRHGQAIGFGEHRFQVIAGLLRKFADQRPGQPDAQLTGFNTRTSGGTTDFADNTDQEGPAVQGVFTRRAAKEVFDHDEARSHAWHPWHPWFLNCRF